MKTKEVVKEAIKDTITKYKEITPVCMTCLDELQKQQAIDEKVYDQKLMDNTVMKLTKDFKNVLWWMMTQ